MAQESFDKEIQFLRLLTLTIGAFTRTQFAQKLGISVHTFDKTLKKLKDTAGSALTDALQSNGYDPDSGNPILLFLFRAKSLRASESQRIATIISLLHEKVDTAADLLDRCIDRLADAETLPDEKTIRNDLKYLEEVGVIGKLAGTRPYRFRLRHELIEQLDETEWQDLFDFVSIMANTQVPSVPGYLLRDHLKKQMAQRGSVTDTDAYLQEAYTFRYHYVSRILDEAHLSILSEAIRKHRSVRFDYFSPKTTQHYTAKNTNPRFERESGAKRITALPVQIIYDHQYGRWYLITNDAGPGIRKYRIDGITSLALDKLVDPAVFSERSAQVQTMMQHSWLVDTGPAVKVIARFFHPASEPEGKNFVKDRVKLQGQWGHISEESEHSFLFEITVNGTQEIKPWLRSFGSSCEVLQPESLRTEFIAEWLELRDTYAIANPGAKGADGSDESI